MDRYRRDEALFITGRLAAASGISAEAERGPPGQVRQIEAGARASLEAPAARRRYDLGLSRLVEWALLQAALLALAGFVLVSVFDLLTTLPLASIVRALGG